MMKAFERLGLGPNAGEQLRLEAPDDDIIRRSLPIELKSFNEEKRSIDVIASTDAIDAYGEIVEQDWDLSRFKRDPVVLFNHNQCGFLGPIHSKDLLPIGYAQSCKVLKNELAATLVFVDAKANEMAELVYQGFLQKSLHAVSVGFRSKDVIEEQKDGKSIYKLRGNELFEISVVPMGANPEAVAQRGLEQLKRLAAETTRRKALVSVPAAIVTPPAAKDADDDEGGGDETTEGVMCAKCQTMNAAAATTCASCGASMKAAKAAPPAPEQDHAASSGKETLMQLTDAQIKALQDDLEAKTKALGAFEAQVKELTTAGTTMKSALEKSEAAVATLSTELTDARKTGEAAAARVKELETATITAKVKALIGKKITGGEFEKQVELAVTNEKLFDEIMALRPDMKLDGKALTDETPPPARAHTRSTKSTDAVPAGATSGGEDLGAMLEEEDAAAE